MVTLGERIRLMRERRGLTQPELARRARVRQALVSELETGRLLETRSGTLKRIAQALGVTSDWLIGMYDEDGQPLTRCPAAAPACGSLQAAAVISPHDGADCA